MRTIIISNVPAVGEIGGGEAAFVDAVDQDTGETIRIAVHHSRLGALIDSFLVAAREAGQARAPVEHEARAIHLFSPVGCGVAPLEGEPALAIQFETHPGVLMSYRLDKQSSRLIAQSLLKWAKTLPSAGPATPPRAH